MGYEVPLGNGNSVTNGDTWAGAGANVNQGHGVLHSVGNDTNTGSGSMIKGNDGPVLQNVDASGGNGGAHTDCYDNASGSGGGDTAQVDGAVDERADVARTDAGSDGVLRRVSPVLCPSRSYE